MPTEIMTPSPQSPASDTSAAAQRDLVVMVVHGTFARGIASTLVRKLKVFGRSLLRKATSGADLWPPPSSDAAQRWWFEAGSKFEQDLLELIDLPGLQIVFSRLLWSGGNSFADRAEAATRLRLELCRSIEAMPNVPHVVLAHSHGGTVALAALDANGAGETPQIAGLLTLGTPFVRLAWRLGLDNVPQNHNGEFEPQGAWWVAAILPGALLLIAPLLAVVLLLHASGALALVGASSVLVLSLVAFRTSSVAGATAIVACLLAFGSADVRWTAISVAVVAIFLSFFLKGRQFRLGIRFVERKPIALGCPMLALRTPRDEASLIIGLGQLAQGAGHWAAKLVGFVMQPVSAAMKFPDTFLSTHGASAWWRTALSQFISYAVIFACAGLLAKLAEILGIWTPPAVGWKTGHLFLVVLMFGFFGWIFMFLLMLAALLLWTIPLFAISLAVGGEAFLIPVRTQVDVEPLPNAVNGEGTLAASMTLEILYDALPVGLNHSSYDSQKVRVRIAKWLQLHLSGCRSSAESRIDVSPNA